MAVVLDRLESRSTERQVIRRLNSGLCRAGTGGDFPLPVAPAPFRVDVPLLDPCSGHLSAGAEAHLGIRGRPEFIDLHQAASSQWLRKRSQTAPDLSGTSTD